LAANVHKQKEMVWNSLKIRKVMDGQRWRIDEAEMKKSKEID